MFENNKVLFIGLSDKIGCTPLQSDTKSGAIIDEIILGVNAECYKINLVNFPPLNKDSKLRYPNEEEMDKGYDSLRQSLKEINPDLCVLLGEKVDKYLKDKINKHISIKHPSYIAVYKKKEKPIYIKNAIEDINKYLKNKEAI